ncbi:MAG: hypothetical protein CPDRYDRY_4898 [uncultured Paraburkholderia sp.]|nr:MAG: hypothetical protein CPDRYDRY_4898 [uncultured Paraburkholderia sp.]
MTGEYGPHFRFDRPFMAWICDGSHKTMGQVADEWRWRFAVICICLSVCGPT